MLEVGSSGNHGERLILLPIDLSSKEIKVYPHGANDRFK